MTLRRPSNAARFAYASPCSSPASMMCGRSSGGSPGDNGTQWAPCPLPHPGDQFSQGATLPISPSRVGVKCERPVGSGFGLSRGLIPVHGQCLTDWACVADVRVASRWPNAGLQLSGHLRRKDTRPAFEAKAYREAMSLLEKYNNQKCWKVKCLSDSHLTFEKSKR